MARIHGRAGQMYIALTSAGSAESLINLKQWSISFSTDNVDVTCMGDLNKLYVAGLPDASGSFAGVYDTASNGTYTAATDGVARKFYLYPTNAIATSYWFGTVLPDFNATGDVSSSVDTSGDWQAASSIIRVG